MDTCSFTRRLEHAGDHLPIGPVITASPAAARLIADTCAAGGPHVFILASSCATRSIVALRPLPLAPADDQLVPIGTVAGCLVRTQAGQARLCPHEAIVIDVSGRINGAKLIARAESEPEWRERTLQRVLAPTLHQSAPVSSNRA